MRSKWNRISSRIIAFVLAFLLAFSLDGMSVFAEEAGLLLDEAATIDELAGDEEQYDTEEDVVYKEEELPSEKDEETNEIVEPEAEEISESSDEVVSIEELDAEGNIASGTSNNVTWVIDANGKLTISGTGDWERDMYGKAPWDGYSELIKNAEVDLADASNLSSMFYWCNNLTGISFGENFDTSGVSNMYGAFAGCFSLSNIDLSRFDTREVKNIGRMFACCVCLSELDLSSFYISSDTYVEDIFYYVGINKIITPGNCYAEILLPNEHKWEDSEGNIYTVMPENSKTIFHKFSITYDLDGGVNNPDNVSDYYGTFNLQNPTKEDYEFLGWYRDYYQRVYSVTNENVIVYAHWKKISHVKWNIDDDGKLTISGTGDWERDMRSAPWLECSDDIVTAEVSLTGVTDTSWMFSYCTNLIHVDLSGSDLSNVTNMSYMFEECYSLKSIEWGDINTSKVTDMSFMFSNCSDMTTIDVSKFDTSNVTNMAGMFRRCDRLISLDLSSFITSNVVNMSEMLHLGGHLSVLDLHSITITEECNANSMLGYFICDKFLTPANCEAQVDLLDSTGRTWYDNEDITYTSLPKSTKELHYNYWIYYILRGGENNPYILSFYHGETTLRNPTREGWTFCGWNDANSGKIIETVKDRDCTVYAKWINSNGELAKGTVNSVDWRITSEGKLIISGTGDWVSSYVDEEGDEVFVSAPWREYSDEVVSAEVHLKGSTDVSNMFTGCARLNSVDLSDFDASTVVDMSGMFSFCQNLESIEWGDINTSQVTNMSTMFFDCKNLTTNDVSQFDTSNVTDMMGMFSGCRALKELDLENWETPKVTDVDNMFAFCTELQELDISNMTLSDTCYAEYMFNGCTNLHKIKTPSCTIEVELPSDKTWCDIIGNEYSLLPEASMVIYAKASIVYELDGGVNNADNVSEYIGEFALKDPTKEGYIFDGWYNKETNEKVTIVSGGDVTVYAKWVKDTCIASGKSNDVVWVIDEEGKLSVTGTGEWECHEADNVIGLGTPWYEHRDEIITAEVNLTGTKYPIYMFLDCKNLTDINLSNFDTSNALSTQGMFYGCSSLESLNLKDFNTSKVENMGFMFYGCNNLTELELGEFVTLNVTDMTAMFEECSSLKKMNVSKFDTSKVLNMTQMFRNCSGLTELDLKNFETSSVTEMNMMFENCNSLTKLNVSSFNTVNVSGMSRIFSGCTALKSIDLNNFSTSNVKYMGGMFQNCKSLEELDLSGFDTANVENMSLMFSNCINLKNLDLSSFTISDKNALYNFLGGCSALISINTPKECKVSVELPEGIVWVDDAGNIYTEFPETSVTLFAKEAEAPSSFTITYELSGGANHKDNPSDYEAAATVSLMNPIKEGYIFDGWFDNAEFSGDEITIVKGKNITVYAKWIPNSYTISFEGNGGKYIEGGDSIESYEQSMIYDLSASLLPNRFEKEGYNFCGWGLDPLSKSVKYSDGAEVKNLAFNGTVTLYAIWAEKEYSITYELNGGTNNKDNPDFYLFGNTVTLKNPSKECNTFDGWYDTETDEKVSIVSGKNISVYAKWIPYTYTITLNGNGGKYTSAGYKPVTTYIQNMAYDVSDVLSNPFTKTGYTLAGWTTKKDGKGTFYEAGSEVINLTKTNKGNVNLYAKWEANEYTVIFDINASEVYEGDLAGEMLPVTVKYGKSVKLPANKLTRKGYTFKGWSLTPDGKVKYKNKTSVKNLVESGNVTLYAVWSINTYKVKFVANGGKGKAPATVKGLQYGVKSLTIPKNTFTNKECYVFTCWNIKKDCTGQIYMPEDSVDLVATKNNQTITLYAVWVYDLTVSLGEGLENKVFTGVYNQAVPTSELEEKLSEIAKTGYYIAGFATSEKNAAKGKCAYTKSVKNAGGKILYPVYKTNKYTVKFDKNAPEGAKVSGKMSSISATYGKSFTLKANAFKCSGHTFKGWSTDKDATEAEFMNKAQITTNLSEKNKDVVILYAIWE